MIDDGLTTKERARRIQLFWEGKTNTPEFKALETKRNKYLAEKAESEGKKVTYVANDGSATLPEVQIIGQKPIQKPYWSDMTTDDWIDAGITAASFVPGLDTAADIADTANQFRQGNWGWGLVGLASTLLPGISSNYFRKGINFFKDIPNKVKNYKRASDISSAMNESLRLNIRRQNKLLKQGIHPAKVLQYQRVGLPEVDPETFYHHMRVRFGQPITARSGQVRLSNDHINPIPGHNGQEGRIWWTKGVVPSAGNNIIITSKSNLIDERVIDHLEKYDRYHGNYSPNDYTSSRIPLKDVKIYQRNPITGHFDQSIFYVPTKTNQGSTTMFDFNTLQDTKDVEALKAFAKQYGYTLPVGIERYSGEMLDKEFQRILKKHNTFGRGVKANNLEDAERFLTTAHVGSAGALDNMPTGKTGIYTMNGLSPYGNYQGVVQRQLDFSGSRSTWITKNDIPYISTQEASQLIQDIQNQYYKNFPYDDSLDYYDNMWKYIKTNYPEIFNSSGQVYKINNTDRIRQIGNPGVVIHGGNPGEKVLNTLNIFKPYNDIFRGRLSTRGFSHKAYQKGGKL